MERVLVSKKNGESTTSLITDPYALGRIFSQDAHGWSIRLTNSYGPGRHITWPARLGTRPGSGVQAAAGWRVATIRYGCGALRARLSLPYSPQLLLHKYHGRVHVFRDRQRCEACDPRPLLLILSMISFAPFLLEGNSPNDMCAPCTENLWKAQERIRTLCLW
jgi:hypothetical protein